MTITSGVCAGLVSLSGLLAAQAQQAENWWNQPRGNAAGTAAVALAGLRSQPIEEWRQPVGELLCEPVVWGGVLYVAARKDDERRLLAFRCQGGEALGSTRLGRGGGVQLAVWGGTVVVVDDSVLQTFTQRAGTLRSAKRLELGAPLGPPCVFGGRLLVSDGKELSLIEIQNLKLLAHGPAGSGRPAVHLAGSAASVATFAIAANPGTYDALDLHVSALADLDKKTPTLGAEHVQRLGAVTNGTRARPGHVAYLGASQGVDLWYVLSPFPLLAKQGGPFQACSSAGLLAPITSSEAVVELGVFGFADDGGLECFDLEGKHARVLEPKSFPEGARPGAASVASDVLYLGNWAVEVASARVLWCLADLEPSTPLVPTEDGRVAVGTSAGELIGYRDASRTSASTVGAGAASAPLRPDASGAVILADGSVLAGPLRRTSEGTLEVPGTGGTARALAESEIAFGRTEAGERIGHDQYPVFVAWRSALALDVRAALEPLIATYTRERFLADARRLLQEALAYGLPAARQRALEDALAGRAQSGDANAEAKRRKMRGEESDARAKLCAAFFAAADWCHARDLDVAATVLVARGRSTQPEEPPGAAIERALALVPPTFPWPESDVAAQRWMEWAEELLPAEGRFLARDDPARSGLPADWREKAIALRTQNLLLFSLEFDPKVIGPCLRKGEGTLRALDELVQPGSVPAPDRAPLEVRIHADRASFLRESERNGLAMAWSAGYYSPSENVSRFYVPRDTDAQPVERALASTLAHELTHHYLDRRWVRMQGGENEPGFWVVEGFARFIEDQVLELGRADRGFEDATVRALDVTAQAARKELLLPLAKLIDLDHGGFAGLKSAPLAELQLRYTIARVSPTELSLFYNEAASLVFFLMNRSGEQGRAALLGYLEDYHRGRARAEGWKKLGWENAAELERAFRAFLRTVSD